MYVTVMQMVNTILLSMFGLCPVWCDSCGMMYTEALEHCEACDAIVCEYCVEDYPEEYGCFVCNDAV